MAKRKAMSKRLRFEVLKRDNFKCQYCGASAPDATLEIDHLIPIKGGGDNEVLNLVTACSDCNRGKAAKSLSDDSMVKKQVKNHEEIARKLEESKLIAKSFQESKDLIQKEMKFIEDEMKNRTGKVFSEHGRILAIKLIKKYSFKYALKALGDSLDRYFDINGDTVLALDKWEVICKIQKTERDDPIQASINKTAHRIFKRYDEEFWKCKELSSMLYANKNFTENRLPDLFYSNNTFYQFKKDCEAFCG